MQSGFDVEQRTRKENGIHLELGMTHKSIIYSCIPESLEYTLNTKSNLWKVQLNGDTMNIKNIMDYATSSKDIKELDLINVRNSVSIVTQ